MLMKMQELGAIRGLASEQTRDPKRELKEHYHKWLATFPKCADAIATDAERVHATVL